VTKAFYIMGDKDVDISVRKTFLILGILVAE
jgi:hypothetical protein